MFWTELLLSRLFGPHAGPCQGPSSVSVETRMAYFWSPLGVRGITVSITSEVCLSSPCSFSRPHIFRPFEASLNTIPEDLPSSQMALRLPFSVLQTLHVTQIRNAWNHEVKGLMTFILVPCFQGGHNPIYPMQKLQIEITEPKMILSLLPAKMNNLHCEYSLGIGDMLSGYGLSSSLKDFCSLFVRWALICQYHEVTLQAASKTFPAMGQWTSTILDMASCGIRVTWKPFSLLILQCFAPPGGLSEMCLHEPVYSSPPIL